MACTDAYAEAWEYAAFFCIEGILTGVDDSGGAANAALSDSTATFEDWKVVAGVGMVAYNVTQGTYGVITALSQTTVTATGVTWDDADVWRIVTLTASEIATVELYLDITSNNIHAALAAVGACDCTLASWAEAYLKKINIIEAGSFHQCPCARASLSDEQKRLLLEWTDRQLELIRTSKIDVCAGSTGADWPSIGWASQGLTERQTAEIIANSIQSEG